MGLVYTSGGMFSAPDLNENADVSAWLLDLAQQVEDQLAPVQMTSGHTAKSGWSVPTFYGHIVARTAFVYLVINRTGTAIAAAANGNIVNSDIVTLPAAFKPASQPGALSVVHTGFLGAFYCWVDGTVGIGAAPPNIGIATGDSFAISGTWRV